MIIDNERKKKKNFQSLVIIMYEQNVWKPKFFNHAGLFLRILQINKILLPIFLNILQLFR